MDIRETLQSHPRAVVVIVVLCLGLVAFTMTRTKEPSRTSGVGSEYFLDLGSGELFSVPLGAIPPVGAPSGKPGVRAYVYSCGKCSTKERFIAYVEQYSATDKQTLEAPRTTEVQLAGVILPQVAAVPASGADPDWIDSKMPRAADIQTIKDCNGPPARRCSP